MATLTPRMVEKTVEVVDGYFLSMDKNEAMLIASLLGVCDREMTRSVLGPDSPDLAWEMYSLLYDALGDDLTDEAYEKMSKALRNKFKG